MTDEPFFNIPEKAPLWLGGLLILIHVVFSVGPDMVRVFVNYWALLIPVGIEGAPWLRQITSLPGHGFLHGSWSHVLVNVGMLVAFGVISLRGIKAMRPFGRHNLIFMMIFLAGVVGGGLLQWAWWMVVDAQSVSALGASGGASALFATTGYAMGGRAKMLQFLMGYAVLNAVVVLATPITGVNISWAGHMGGYFAGMILAPFWVQPSSSGFSITR